MVYYSCPCHCWYCRCFLLSWVSLSPLRWSFHWSCPWVPHYSWQYCRWKPFCPTRPPRPYAWVTASAWKWWSGSAPDTTAHRVTVWICTQIGRQTPAHWNWHRICLRYSLLLGLVAAVVDVYLLHVPFLERIEVYSVGDQQWERILFVLARGTKPVHLGAYAVTALVMESDCLEHFGL